MTFEYSAGAADEVVSVDPLEVFQYSDSGNCPFTSCTLHAAGDCGGSLFSS